LPLMKEILLRTSARFSSLPAERSSRTTTLWPRRMSSSTVFEPMKPAPQVTTKRMRKAPPHQAKLQPQRDRCPPRKLRSWREIVLYDERVRGKRNVKNEV